MALQTDKLKMIALGVWQDSPPQHTPQVKLGNGIHLRWMFEKDLGFPWYGFYLFRRTHLSTPEPCNNWAAFRYSYSAESTGVCEFENDVGVFSSNQDMVITDEFSPNGWLEMSLEEREYLKMAHPPDEPMRKVEAEIAFVGDGLTSETVDFSDYPEDEYDNPLTSAELTFTALDGDGQPVATVEIKEFDSRSTLVCREEVAVTLPDPVNYVELTLLAGDAPGTVLAKNSSEEIVASMTLQGTGELESLGLAGEDIVSVHVLPGDSEQLLDSVKYNVIDVNGETHEVHVSVYSGEHKVYEETVEGLSGEVKLFKYDLSEFNSVLWNPGPARLRQVCCNNVSQDSRTGWQLVPNCTTNPSDWANSCQPFSLPVYHPDYPCVSMPRDEAAARALAESRELDGTKDNTWFNDNFSKLHDELEAIVAGGPGGTPMFQKSTFEQGVSVPVAASDEPTMQERFHLDYLALSTVDVDFAQMLGLYYYDDSTQLNVAYDYLIVADYRGKVDENDPAGWIANKGFDDVEAYILPCAQMEQHAALSAPDNPVGYNLPGMMVPDHNPQAIPPLINAVNNAGLTWDLGISGNILLTRSPVLYHVWRSSLGDAIATPSGPEAIDQHSLLTDGQPVLIGDSLITPGQNLQRPKDWPQEVMHYIDRALDDGWYSYRITGIDIFGRWTEFSAPAMWKQWQPVPNPEPWYYVPGLLNNIKNNYAVDLRDKTPPPVPTAIEAFALDPFDPYVVQDPKYNTWRAAVLPPDTIGLRVTWRWTPMHMRAAPDTKEFRIYYNPGYASPNSGAAANQWNERIYVNDYANSYTLEPDGTRFYDVILPLLPPPPGTVTGFSMPVSESSPIYYANVGITAVDDKISTGDDAKWNGTPFGNRTGNESVVSPAALVFRVFRKVPSKPNLPIYPKECIEATAADYHAESFYTFRWIPSAHMKTHILRAVDNTLFQIDWGLRAARGPLGHGDAAFPASYNSAEKSAVIADIAPLDSAVDFAAALPIYEGLNPKALWVLANLEGNEEAFAQLTIQPLDPNAPANADKVGPDNDLGYSPSSSLRAYVDTLDGKTTSKYFYRYAYVNSVHITGPPSDSTPPICLPDVVPPLKPKVTKTLGGDKQITIKWASNREPDLKEYRVYRAESADDARDIRSMELVQTVVETLAPASRPAEVSWVDDSLIGGTKYYYRITALDTNLNSSTPGSVKVSMPYEYLPPNPPQWDILTYQAVNGLLIGKWKCDYIQECIVMQKSATTGNEKPISKWLSGKYDGVSGNWLFEVAIPGFNQIEGSSYFIIGRTKVGNKTISTDLQPT